MFQCCHHLGKNDIDITTFSNSLISNPSSIINAQLKYSGHEPPTTTKLSVVKAKLEL